MITFSEHRGDLPFGLTVHYALQGLVLAAAHIPMIAHRGTSASGRKPSHCPHCEGSLKGDFASGHLGKSIARDSRLGFLPKNVSEIEQVLVWEFYD